MRSEPLLTAEIKEAFSMSWEDRFSSIVKETESNLSRVRDRLGSSKGMSSAYNYGDSSASRAASNNYLGGSRGNVRPTRYSSSPGKQTHDFRTNHRRSLSPVRTPGLSSGVPNGLSSQTSPALVKALFERVEQQAEVISSLTEAVRAQERTQRSQAGEMKRMQDGIRILSDRLQEKGVDLETERKLEQFKRDICSQLEMVQSQVRIQKSADEVGYQRSESGGAAALVKDLHESKRMLQDDNDALRREFDHLKTRLAKLEVELQPTVSNMREIQQRQDRLDRTVGSLSESQRSQSRSLSSVVDDHDIYYRDLRQLRNALDKLGRQVSELDSDFSQNSLPKSYQAHPSLSNGSLSEKGPKKLSAKARLTNGDLKPNKKQRRYKSKAADALLELGLSDSDADLSLTTLDLSSTSDSSLQLNKSFRDAGVQLDNLSSTSLSSLDSDDLLGAFPH